MRSGWINEDSFALLLTALMPGNRLALEVSLRTGLRIGDVLALESAKLAQRMVVRESKTGKKRRVYIPGRLLRELQQLAGKRYVFEGRCDWRKHRSRAAVYKDLRRVCALYRLDGQRVRAHLSPHSARKIYAVAEMRRGGIERVKRLLQHESEAVTMIYAMADELEARRQHPAPRPYRGGGGGVTSGKK